MKKSQRQMKKNVMQRVPKEIREVVAVAVENNPRIAGDIDKIMRTHSCHPSQAFVLAEHIVALIASEFPHADRAALRKAAFGTTSIDDDKKALTVTTIEEITRDEDGYSVTMGSGWSMWLQFAEDGYEPKIGSTIWQYTICFSEVLGVVVDGHVFRYETLAQRDARLKAELEQRRENERAKFAEHDADIAKLPEIFQRRIQKFQRAPFFREDLERYEIFVCEQAALFAKRLKTVQKLIKWCNLNYAHKMKFMPELDKAGHTGNTFGAACLFARIYLEQPEQLLEVPGALAPLVGSNAYLPAEERIA